MWRAVSKMRAKAALVVEAPERYLNHVVPEARHMRAKPNTIILVHVKQDLDKCISPCKPVIKLGKSDVKFEIMVVSCDTSETTRTHTPLSLLNW